MAHFLITGGCGFIGSHLVDALIARGDNVRILDDLSTGRTINRHEAVELVIGDVADAAIVRAAMAGVDGCFHLAAVASVEQANRDWLGCHRTNLSGAITVFDAARRVNAHPVPVVYTSSAAVYGDPVETPLPETAATRPLSAYGADKLGCELHARVATHVHGVPTVGVRFFNIFGPRQDPASPYSGVVSIFANRLAAGKSVTIFGDGRQTRDFVYVADAVRALIAAMDRQPVEHAVFNVCTGVSTSVLELAQTLAGICRRPLRLEFCPARGGEIRDSLGNPALARTWLGFEARTTVAAGLAALLDYQATVEAE